MAGRGTGKDSIDISGRVRFNGESRIQGQLKYTGHPPMPCVRDNSDWDSDCGRPFRGTELAERSTGRMCNLFMELSSHFLSNEYFMIMDCVECLRITRRIPEDFSSQPNRICRPWRGALVQRLLTSSLSGGPHTFRLRFIEVGSGGGEFIALVLGLRTGSWCTQP